jgi:hypothetical protein
LSATTHLRRRAVSPAISAGLLRTSLLLRPMRFAISPAWGVITIRPLWRARMPLRSFSRPNAPASRTKADPGSQVRMLAVTRAATSSSIMPGPISAASQRAIRSRNRRAASGSISPASVSGSPMTSASGTARPKWSARLWQVAIWSFPAPARRAAVAARRAAPGTARLPPMTSTRPRWSLSPSSAGCGRGRRRRRSAVIAVSLIVPLPWHPDLM